MGLDFVAFEGQWFRYFYVFSHIAAIWGQEIRYMQNLLGFIV